VASASFHIRLGDLAAWVGGVATAVALILTWLLLRATVRDQREAREGKRRAQARQVSAWPDQVTPGTRAGSGTVMITVQNLSDEPIYAVRAAVGAAWFGENIRYEELDIFYVIPPKSTRQQPVAVEFGQTGGGGSSNPVPPVELIFYDAAHKDLWRRDRFGELSRIAEEGSQTAVKNFFQKSSSS
jgi:hypothetical protein